MAHQLTLTLKKIMSLIEIMAIHQDTVLATITIMMGLIYRARYVRILTIPVGVSVRCVRVRCDC